MCGRYAVTTDPALLAGEIDAVDWLRSLAGHVRGHRELLEKSAAQ